MKIFITVEVEKLDYTAKGGMSEKTFMLMQKFITAARKENIPVQYKDTDLPRFRRASDT